MKALGFFTIIFLSLLSKNVFGQKTSQISLSNSLGIARADELIVLPRKLLEKKFGAFPIDQYVIVTTKDKAPIVVQYDDMTGDGIWDELAFLYSFKPKENIILSLAVAKVPATIKAVVRAHVRHRKKNADDSFGPIVTKDVMPDKNPPTDFSKIPLPPYLTEGPAWENDKIAFRMYFDTRNGKDVFGKIVPGMVMDTIGANHNNSYHELSNWGMDVLHVGKSLGAGAIAIATKDINGKDTLIRLGGPNVKNETYEMIADGPVRAIFRLKFDWVINNRSVQIIDETSIWGGQFFYETKLKITGAPVQAKLVAGFADFYDNKPGQLATSKTKIFYSFGPQSENKDNLGLAVAVPAMEFSNYYKIGKINSDIQESYIVSQKIKTGKPVLYRFYSGWARADKRFATKEGFGTFLNSQAATFTSSIIVK